MIDWAQITTSTELVAALTGAVGAFSAWWLTARKQHLDAAARGDEVDLKKRIELDAWTAAQFERLDARIALLEIANRELTTANITISENRIQLMTQIAELRKEIEFLKFHAANLIETAKTEAANLIETAKTEAANLIETANK